MVLITVSIFEEDGGKIEDYNCDKFLLKPFKTDEMFQCLAKLLDIEFEEENQSSEELLNSKSSKLDFSKLTLPSNLLFKLKNGAQNYNIKELSKSLGELSKSGAKGLALANHLKVFSQKYDYQKVLAALNQV